MLEPNPQCDGVRRKDHWGDEILRVEPPRWAQCPFNRGRDPRALSPQREDTARTAPPAKPGRQTAPDAGRTSAWILDSQTPERGGVNACRFSPQCVVSVWWPQQTNTGLKATNLDGQETRGHYDDLNREDCTWTALTFLFVWLVGFCLNLYLFHKSCLKPPKKYEMTHLFM